MYSTTALSISMQFCSAGTFPQNDLQHGRDQASWLDLCVPTDIIAMLDRRSSVIVVRRCVLISFKQLNVRSASADVMGIEHAMNSSRFVYRQMNIKAKSSLRRVLG